MKLYLSTNVLQTLNLLSLIKLNDKTGVTSANIRKTGIIPIRLYAIQLIYYDRYEKRVKPSSWHSDKGGSGVRIIRCGQIALQGSALIF